MDNTREILVREEWSSVGIYFLRTPFYVQTALLKGKVLCATHLSGTHDDMSVHVKRPQPDRTKFQHLIRRRLVTYFQKRVSR